MTNPKQLFHIPDQTGGNVQAGASPAPTFSCGIVSFRTIITQNPGF
ncbi:hypothetical protein QNI19_02725 [Cytophagaceae bacterium DM2B3-1]|uniref:Uncharacterized protein n=1 Tax=Xanthocytophaga flava TaxID=3048013 RepID=A0ABT7CGJ1_9BACT|nr:hypothetical protein [Xanthocytophaga flavus]MDJ1473150.1 hypothetical protein [Xanthocytophaga flavus]MDJ1491829.1 hypothetical protein [Xanthocytophaga flavus]